MAALTKERWEVKNSRGIVIARFVFRDHAEQFVEKMCGINSWTIKKVVDWENGSAIVRE